jgi:predicted Rossmann-fold nucleotide-binding protein
MILGGFGTLDEVFETAVLMQTDKILEFPIILMGRSYWDQMHDFLRQTLVPEKTIKMDDLTLFQCTDDLKHVIHLIQARQTPISE